MVQLLNRPECAIPACSGCLLLLFLFDFFKIIPVPQLLVVYILIKEFVDFVYGIGTGDLTK